MNKKAIITAMLALVAFFLASCSSDDDKVELVTFNVSSETGTYQNVPDNNSVEGMLIKENGAANWKCVSSGGHRAADCFPE